MVFRLGVDDDVIEERDANDVADLDHAVGEGFVVCLCGHVSRFSVVAHVEVAAVLLQRQPVNLHRLDLRLGRDAERDQLDVHHFIFFAQPDGPEVLALAAYPVLAQQDLAHDAGYVLRRFDQDALCFSQLDIHRNQR